MKLSQVAQILSLPEPSQDKLIHSVSIDTRTLKPGALFIALPGPQFDGHDYLAEAAEAGAVAAVVQNPTPVSLSFPLLKVSDSQAALTLLAQSHRREMNLTVAAVTGSCGKTTTKTLLANILSLQGNTLANPSSYNNHLGVPLTLLQLRNEHQFAVCEVGANHPGEIVPLTQLIQPNITVITNAKPVHLSGFGSLRGVAEAKGEIFQGLNAEGIAVINQDDAYADYWKQLNKGRQVVTFGVHQRADVTASDIQCDHQMRPSFRLVTSSGEVTIQLQLVGEHNVYNALAAAAVAHSLSVPLEMIQQGLSQTKAVDKRLRKLSGLSGSQIIDDSYNANPASVKAAIEVVVKCSGVPVLVLGDMTELGVEADRFHKEVGEFAVQTGIHYLYCYGERSKLAVEAFGERGYFYSDKQELVDEIKKRVDSNMTILVKGSRSMHMEEVVEALIIKKG